MEFIIEGEAVPKQSFRFSRFGNYQPARVTNYKTYIGYCFKKQYPENEPLKDPIKVNISIYKMPPRSWSKKKQNEAISGSIKATSKPDVDNYTKNILDALNGIAYVDDSQVIELTIKKTYALKDYVVVKIEVI